MIFATGAVCLFALFFGLLWFLGRMRCRWDVHPEVCRKISHVVMGMACLAFPLFVSATWQILCLAVCFTASLALLRKSESPVCVALDVFRATRRRSLGEFHFIMGVALAFILAGEDRFAYVSSILILTFADAAAGSCGRAFGKMQCWGNTKTLEGSLMFAAVSLLCMGLATAALIDHPVFWVCLPVCAAATLAEGLAIRGSDNLWIPLACVVCLRSTHWLPSVADAGWLAVLPLASLGMLAIWLLRRIHASVLVMTKAGQ